MKTFQTSHSRSSSNYSINTDRKHVEKERKYSQPLLHLFTQLRRQQRAVVSNTKHEIIFRKKPSFLQTVSRNR